MKARLKVEGFLKQFDYRRGFGFIEVIGRPDADDIFVHAHAFVGGPEGVPLGARLRFDVVEARNGKLQAAHARAVRAGELGPVVLPPRARGASAGGGGVAA